MNDINESDNLLNDDWIVQFENNDKLYQDFYQENIYYTNLLFFYINKDFEIVKIKQDSFLMSVTNCITREEILGLIKKNQIDNKIKYKLFSIMKYNINLDCEDVGSFMKNTEKFDFFLPIQSTAIDSIYFDKSIHMFHDLNDLIFIFHQQSGHFNKTKKISIHHYLKNTQNKITHTRKIF
jgi:hypothetical protein